jgi:hypothetical protein
VTLGLPFLDKLLGCVVDRSDAVPGRAGNKLVR